MPKVKCSVHSCKYWEEGNECSADQIWVLPEGASRETEVNTETFCQTFEQAEEYREPESYAAAPNAEGVNRDTRTGQFVSPNDMETAPGTRAEEDERMMEKFNANVNENQKKGDN